MQIHWTNEVETRYQTKYGSHIYGSQMLVPNNEIIDRKRFFLMNKYKKEHPFPDFSPSSIAFHLCPRLQVDAIFGIYKALSK